MATVREDNIPHVVRTAADQRQKDMFNATIGRIEQVNSTIRLLRLYLDNDQVGRLRAESLWQPVAPDQGCLGAGGALPCNFPTLLCVKKFRKFLLALNPSISSYMG